MKKQFLAAGIALALACTSAHAQFKMPGFGKKTEGTADAAKPAEAPPTGDALVTAFQTSQLSVLDAQLSLSEALAIKDKLAELEATRQRLASGQLDTDALKKSRETSDSAQAVIDAAIAAAPQLSAEQKAKFLEGLVHYGKAVLSAKGLLVQAQQFVGSAGANPLGLVGKARTAMWVGKETPGYAKGLFGTTKQLFAFAKRNGIAPPANATAALEGL